MAKEIKIHIRYEKDRKVARLIMALLDLGYSVSKDRNYLRFELGGEDSIIPPNKNEMFKE